MIPENKYKIFLSWFILALTSLALSGIYSILPFALRTPGVSSLVNLPHNFFKISLIVHVNLGVLVWFLSNLAMMMQLIISHKYNNISFSSLLLAIIGGVFIVASPFIGHAEPILNNYVPILHNLTFVIGLSIFLTAILLQVMLGILSWKEIKDNIEKLQIFIAAVIFLVAVFCLILAATHLKKITRFIDLNEYYEQLFWGFGHVLQFIYIQLLVVSWFFLLGPDLYLNEKNLIKKLSWINLIFIIISPFAYFLLTLNESYLFFTQQMRYVGGLFCFAVGLILCKNLFKETVARGPFSIISLSRTSSSPHVLLCTLRLCGRALLELIQKSYLAQRSLKNKVKSSLNFFAFICSLVLIMGGGIIGYLISGANVTVPAHYHGLITGITVSLMGLFYFLLGKLDKQKINFKTAKLQLFLYSFGQILHIIGLAISGGYGALRKDPTGQLSAKAKIYMSIMGTGGGIALIGGIMFIYLIYKALLKRGLK